MFVLEILLGIRPRGSELPKTQILFSALENDVPMGKRREMFFFNQMVQYGMVSSGTQGVLKTTIVDTQPLQKRSFPLLAASQKETH